MYHTRIIIWLIISSFPVSNAAASNFFNEPEPLPSIVTLELGTDAVGSQDTFFSTNIALRSGNRLKFAIGSTSYDGQIDDSTSFSIGFTGDPSNKLVFGFSYDFLKREESLLFLSTAVRLKMKKDSVLTFVTWQQDDWIISFKPQIRNILLQPRNANANRGIRSPGFELSVSYLGLDDFSLYASRSEFSYSSNIDLLKAIALRSGQFDKSRTSAAIDYNVDWGSVGLEWQRNKAIDNIDVYDVTLVNVFLILSDSWSVQGQLGSPSGGSINTDGFGSLALSYSW